jgi:hypothetical protein
MFIGLVFGNAAATLADDNDNFTLVVQLNGFRRAQNGAVVSRQGIRCAHKQGGKFGFCTTVFVFGVSICIVHTDTGNFFGLLDRWQPGNLFGAVVNG